MEHLDRAISIVGSQSALATQCGVVQGAVSNWRQRKSIPAEYCPAIERATAGAVRCEDLRPDVDWSVLRDSARVA
ncbi:helix-turn-helix domain-containing protein [Tessaracoccus sp.]|uniref:helix-turn-helix domain-containing protein n=1 Tax=Tessaracoccus sp. TaxID=1971211 RepID=UPI00344CADB3